MLEELLQKVELRTTTGTMGPMTLKKYKTPSATSQINQMEGWQLKLTCPKSIRQAIEITKSKK
jgi:hypothetical protein